MSQSIPFLQSLLSLLLLLLCTNYAFCDPLVNFQVAQPPPFVIDSESLQCTTTILQRTFGSSIGEYATLTWSLTVYMLMLVDSSPAIVQYTPPTGCGTPDVWAGVTLNFTVTIHGTQYPRVAFFTFQNVEIWRSSTPIPAESGPDGIVWTYVKDVTRFIPLFSKPGTFILQLDNVVESGLDGEFAVTLEATIFSNSSQFPPAQRADLIVPLTTGANNTGNQASVPPGFSVEVTLPRNAVTAFAELQASEDGDEVLWFSHVPNQFLNYFPVEGIVAGGGPFREVRVLVDGQVAGVAFPYAFLSSGILVPSAWRPITSYGALDIPTYHLDLTPFIPILTNGQPHNITLDVASAEPDHQINKNWYLSGLLQVNLDSSTSPTTGNITLYQADDYAVSTATGSNDSDINIVVNASRSIHIEAEIIAGSGEQNQSGIHTESGIWECEPLSKTPTAVYLVTAAQIDHAYERVLLPAPFIMGTTIIEHQVAAGTMVNTSSNVIVFDNRGGTLAPSS
ncbi:peptide N-acetyl-beta-D-glucosaminyl asparaginase amidase A-domain-containing protein [Lactarius hengduanensis]|nr:peptide N-acetyl-beta-D-glucosaminyl asparaginase amidase A-domain-containing protein [Lactarius hengduanensis]